MVLLRHACFWCKIELLMLKIGSSATIAAIRSYAMPYFLSRLSYLSDAGRWDIDQYFTTMSNMSFNP